MPFQALSISYHAEAVAVAPKAPPAWPLFCYDVYMRVYYSGLTNLATALPSGLTNGPAGVAELSYGTLTLCFVPRIKYPA